MEDTNSFKGGFILEIMKIRNAIDLLMSQVALAERGAMDTSGNCGRGLVVEIFRNQIEPRLTLEGLGDYCCPRGDPDHYGLSLNPKTNLAYAEWMGREELQAA